MNARRCLSSLAAIASLVPVTSIGIASAGSPERPRVTNRCPARPLPLRPADLPALRRAGLAVAQHGVMQVPGQRAIDYRGAHATARIGTFYTRYVRQRCPGRQAATLIARTADVAVSYPRITWSASLSSSVFLVARTAQGYVAWAQMH